MQHFAMCLLLASASVASCSSWTTNILVTFSNLLAQGANLTDSWVCYQNPLNTKESYQYVALPVNFSIIENDDSYLTFNTGQFTYRSHVETLDYSETARFSTDPLHIYSLPGPFSILSPSPVELVTNPSGAWRGACNETTCCLDEPHGVVCGSGYIPQNCPENCPFQGFLFQNKTGDCPYMDWTGNLETRRIFYNYSQGLSEPHEGIEQCYLFTNHSVWDIRSPKDFNETRLFNDTTRKPYKHILGTFSWWNPLTMPLPFIKALNFSHPNKTRQVCAPHGFYFLCAPKQPIWVDRHILGVPEGRLVLAYSCLTNQWHRSTCGLGMLSWTTLSIFRSGNWSISHTHLEFEQSVNQSLDGLSLTSGKLSPWGELAHQEVTLRHLSQQLGHVAFDPDFEFLLPQVDAVYSLTNMVLNYRLTFEYLLAVQHGVCLDMIITCCTYVNNSNIVEENVTAIKEKAKWQHNLGESWHLPSE